MKHEIIIGAKPEGFVPAEDMTPFYTVRQETMSLLTGGILKPTPVGIRFAGYFRFTGPDSTAEERESAVKALEYGLMTAQFRLTDLTEIRFQPLYTERKEEFIREANEALVQSDSPYQLTEVIFTYADYCVKDDNSSQSTGRYTGFIMGQSGTRQITVHKPKGIPGEWQCVCGVWSTPGDVCETCGIARPATE